MPISAIRAQFNCIDFPADKVLLLSGGVGITPVMSMARWHFNTNTEVDMVFAHSARTPADIIYRAELDYMSTRIDNFKLHLICERSEIGQIWGGYRGYLSHAMLKLTPPTSSTARCSVAARRLICMRAVRQVLVEAGYDMSRYHEESFGATPQEDIAAAEEQAAIAQTEGPQASHWVTFSNSGKSVEASLGATLYEAAASAGLTIPKACGMGICGTCKVRLWEGEADMAHNGGISEEEVDKGYVLSCCSQVTGPVTVEY